MDAEMRSERRRFLVGDGYWIVDPIGHRHLAVQTAPKEGEIVDTFLGPMPVIVSAGLYTDEWVCDFCNDEMPPTLTLGFGPPEPWPTPCLGSYALCIDCALKVLRDYELEFWPMNGCSCPACMRQMERLLAKTPGWLAREMVLRGQREIVQYQSARGDR